MHNAIHTPSKPINEILNDFLKKDGFEKTEQGQKKLFSAICEMVDEHGADNVFQVLSSLRSNYAQDAVSMAGEAIKKACFRTKGIAFGRSYEAHLKLMPVIIRGKTPSHFPFENDHLTGKRIHMVLRGFFQQIPGGKSIWPLPINSIFTHDELGEMRGDTIHNILKQAIGSMSDRSYKNGQQYVNITTSLINLGQRSDPEMFDLSPPSIGLQGWEDRNRSVVAGKRHIVGLKPGHWVTFRLIPVVLLVPLGQEVPEIEDFGSFSNPMGAAMSFAGQVTGTKKTVSPQFSMTPMGLFDVSSASAVARTKIAYERCWTDFSNIKCLMDENSSQVFLDFNAIDNVFTMNFNDGRGFSGGCQVSMKPGLRTQEFLENLARDIRNSGVIVRVDHGDGMLRIGPIDSMTLH